MIAAATEIDLSRLSDSGLRKWQRYWLRRLHARGGGWLAEDMANEARRTLPKIEAELIKRGLEVEDREPEPAA